MSTTWKELIKKAHSPAVQAEVNEWADLPSLHDMFDAGGSIARWTDQDVAEHNDALPVALRYCYDIQRRGLVGYQSDFMRDMVQRASAFHSLTNGQVRGVLNVLGGGLKRNRARFWKSRGRRRDRERGFENCLVCGGPLTTDEAVSRGVGETCYRRVMGA